MVEIIEEEIRNNTEKVEGIGSNLNLMVDKLNCIAKGTALNSYMSFGDEENYNETIEEPNR